MVDFNISQIKDFNIIYGNNISFHGCFFHFSPKHKKKLCNKMQNYNEIYNC